MRRHAPILLAIALALGTGLRGIDFGKHWDESWAREIVHQQIASGVLLPQASEHSSYSHPTFSYLLSLVALLPVALRCGAPVKPCLLFVSNDQTRFSLQARPLFLCVTLLAGVWLYLALLLYRRSAAVALLGAAALLFSWEIEYHARFVAPDALLMQFSALVLLLLVLAHLRAPRWQVWAGFAAGLGLSAKYPGGLLLLPVLISIFTSTKEGRWRRAIAALGLFAAAFFTTTPGALFDTRRFVGDVLFEVQHYSSGHYGHTVQPGLPHLGLELEYLGAVLFSHWLAPALFFSLLAICGAAALAREDRRLALVLFSYPAVYLAYFALQRVLIVRNLLTIAPFLAFFCASGASFLVARLPRLRWPLAAACAIALAANAAWLIFAAESIARRGSADPFTELAQRLRREPGSLALSSPLRAMLGMHHLLNPWPAPPSPGAPVVFHSSEVRLDRWLINHRGRYHLLPSGPFEVNWDYYPTWAGDPRILITSAADAERMEVRLAQ